LLGYCGLGTFIKVSGILLNDKNLELLRAYLGHASDSGMSSVFPKMKKQTQKTLRRYFRDELGGIYIVPKCPSRLPAY
jgi:hypothetical protein